MFPDRWVKWEIAVSICTAIITASACYTLGTGAYKGLHALAVVIDDASKEKSCGTFTGTVGGFKYRYRATGDNCDTTAQEKTIEGKRHLASTNNQICGTECWDMSHSGTWNGYLAIGKSSIFNDNIYCGPNLSFEQCTNGGKKDL